MLWHNIQMFRIQSNLHDKELGKSYSLSKEKSTNTDTPWHDLGVIIIKDSTAATVIMLKK